MAPRGVCRTANCDRSPYFLTQYDTVDGCRSRRRAISSIDTPSANHCSSCCRSTTTRTLVRVPDGKPLRHRAIDREVQLRLQASALGPKLGDRALARLHAAVQPRDLQPQEVRVEGGDRGIAPGRAHDELADERREL